MKKIAKLITLFTAATLVAVGCAGSTVRAVAPGDASACAGLEAADGSAASRALDEARLTRIVHSERKRLKFTIRRVAGVELYVAARPGMTAQWLQRVAECKLAEQRTGAGQGPLAVPGARVAVRPASKGYLVRITADDREHARELVRRAEQTFARR